VAATFSRSWFESKPQVSPYLSASLFAKAQ